MNKLLLGYKFILQSYCINKKKVVPLQREPTMGVCEWQGSCTLRCEQINVCGYIRTLQNQCLNSIWIHSLIQTRWASRHVEKGVCWSAVLILESRKFNISSQSIRNDECPRGVNFRILSLGRVYPYKVVESAYITQYLYLWLFISAWASRCRS